MNDWNLTTSSFCTSDFEERLFRPDILTQFKENDSEPITLGVELTRYNQDAKRNPQKNKIASRLAFRKPAFAWFRDVSALSEIIAQKNQKYEESYKKASMNACWLIIHSHDSFAHDFLETKNQVVEGLSQSNFNHGEEIVKSPFERIFLFNMRHEWLIDLKIGSSTQPTPNFSPKYRLISDDSYIH